MGVFRAAARARHEDNIKGNHHTEILCPTSCFLQRPIIFENCTGVLQSGRLTRHLEPKAKRSCPNSHPHDAIDTVHLEY
jgi:hypothetical protein